MKQFFAGMLCVSSLMLVGFQQPKKEKQYEYRITEDSGYERFETGSPFGTRNNRNIKTKTICDDSDKYGKLVQVVLLKNKRTDLPGLEVIGEYTAHYYWEKEK